MKKKWIIISAVAVILVATIIVVLVKLAKSTKKIPGTNLTLGEVQAKILAAQKQAARENTYSGYFESSGKLKSDAPDWFRDWYIPKMVVNNNDHAKVISEIVNYQADTYSWQDFVNNANKYPAQAHQTIDRLFTTEEAVIIKQMLGREYGISTFL